MSKEIIVKHKAKDSLFTHLFREKQYVLRLFQALHPEETDVTEDSIELVTLDNVFVDGIYNDLGFMLGKHLIVLVEAQSTWSVNIIIRALLYTAETYNDYIANNNLYIYGSKRIEIPRPELYVIYTGSRKIEKDVISLSEEFFDGVQADLDVRVHVLTGGSEDDIISQYIGFTKVLDEQIKKYGRTRKAIEETIRICKDRNLLSEYLSEHESEVRTIMINLFDEEQIMKAYTYEKVTEAEARGEVRGEARGRAEGEARGRAEGRTDDVKLLLKAGLSPELIANSLNMPLAEVAALKE